MSGLACPAAPCTLPADGRAALDLTRSVASGRDSLRWAATDHPAYVGEGASRVCLKLPCQDHVVKVDALPDGGGHYGSQSRRELRVWRWATRELRPLLAPVLASGTTAGRTWVVMPFCQNLRDAGHSEAASDAAYEHLFDRAVRLGVRDIYPTNVGWFAGRLVVRDYGYPSPASTPW